MPLLRHYDLLFDSACNVEKHGSMLNIVTQFGDLLVNSFELEVNMSCVKDLRVKVR